jgi:uncharacterized tellurite resistance protein B-like protein
MPFSQVEILRAACCVAGHDGQISQTELSLLRKLAERAGVGAASLGAMMARASSDPEFYREQFRLVTKCGEEAIKTLFLVAIADHELTEAEVRMLWHFSQQLGVDEARFRQIHAAASKQIRETSATSQPPPEA